MRVGVLPVADFSLALARSYFCTLSNIVTDTNYNRGPLAGHHGIDVSRGRDNLITDCVFNAPQVQPGSQLSSTADLGYAFAADIVVVSSSNPVAHGVV
jgi:hypothetical protein